MIHSKSNNSDKSESKRRKKPAKSESRERMNTVSLRSFLHEKAICCKESRREEINGGGLIRKKRTATAIN